MNQATSLVLSNLIPRHSGALPPELLDLTSSLIAQSRVKCSLSQEQEIGRTYACANLACERLKTTLNLPKIEPRPPVPPRVYKKLYAYIEDSLNSATPRKRARVEESGGGNGSGNATRSRTSSFAILPKKRTPGRNDVPMKTILPLPQRSTPSRSKSLASFRTPKKGLQYEKRDDARIPRWVGVVGRELCAKLEMVEATPHVLAGVESLIFREWEKERRGEETLGKWPVMMMVVFIIIWNKLKLKKLFSGEEFVENRLRALGVLREARRDKEIGRKVGDGGWDGWDLPEGDDAQDGEDGEGEEEEEEKVQESRNAADVYEWVTEVTSKGCLEMDWYLNISEGNGPNDEDDDQEREEALDEGGRAHVREHEMRYGLGTMRQMKVDYLSEEKRAAYRVWEKDMLAKIARQLRDAVKDGDVTR
ncbi:hypothetical protein DSL72_007206 [Monilinia vaccinii-corymbosi]|uniref:ORC6 first cyclin-like domain-containing protein n=1 Tax=Monilinia vaccinii-corymbosi TaxID=61207 RepID=A0A8A3PL11_9HELO|nr:hypothetical protein DSL72_007206 [Monilinia vaccinii-corymbosi]